MNSLVSLKKFEVCFYSEFDDPLKPQSFGKLFKHDYVYSITTEAIGELYDKDTQSWTGAFCVNGEFIYCYKIKWGDSLAFCFVFDMNSLQFLRSFNLNTYGSLFQKDEPVFVAGHYPDRFTLFPRTFFSSSYADATEKSFDLDGNLKSMRVSMPETVKEYITKYIPELNKDNNQFDLSLKEKDELLTYEVDKEENHTLFQIKSEGPF